DSAYEKAGARIAKDVFPEAELIVKVKEPQPEERGKLHEKHVLFTYLHLAPDPAQVRDLAASGAICIAYETVTKAGGGLALIAPRRGRAARALGGPRHRRGAGRGRGGPQAGVAPDGEGDENGRGGGRHRDRPGRLLRDLAADHARRSHLRGGRRGALLRHQHA